MSLQDVLKKIESANEFRKCYTSRGVKYVLKVLSVEDEMKVNASMDGKDLEAKEYYAQYRKELLARAIIQIDGEYIPEVVECEEKGEMIKKDRALFLKEKVLSTFTYDSTEKMFDAYIDLREESAEDIEKETEYEWFKTPEQREKESEQRIREEQEREKKESTEKEDEDVEDVKLEKVNDVGNPDVPDIKQ